MMDGYRWREGVREINREAETEKLIETCRNCLCCCCCCCLGMRDLLITLFSWGLAALAASQSVNQFRRQWRLVGVSWRWGTCGRWMAFPCFGSSWSCGVWLTVHSVLDWGFVVQNESTQNNFKTYGMKWIDYSSLDDVLFIIRDFNGTWWRSMVAHVRLKYNKKTMRLLHGIPLAFYSQETLYSSAF